MGYSIMFLVVIGLCGNCLLTTLIHGAHTFMGPKALPWERNVCGSPFECSGLALTVVLLFGNIHGQRNIRTTTTARIKPTTTARITPTTLAPITPTTTTTTPAIACPPNYSLYTESCGRFCYRIESSYCQNWDNARKACQAEGGDLLEPSECNYEFFRVRTIGNTGSCGGFFWLGAQRSTTDRNNFRTLKGDTILSTANFWAPGQPNNQLGNQDCLEMSIRFEGKANDNQCRNTGGYICQK